MADGSTTARKSTLDKDLEKLTTVEEAAGVVARGLVPPGLALLFIVVVTLFATIFFFGEPGAVFIIAAAAIGGYMALNIGANDVANNVGPAVGAKALTMGGALVLAAIFESAGALIAGGDVVDTVSRGIIDQEAIGSAEAFVRLMLAALMASALWVHLATWLGAPVSTTHSIVGGICGAGVATVGFAAVNWSILASITLSWVVSPVLGGVIAAAVLAFIKARIIYQDDKISAARRWVPVLIGIMFGAFVAYLAAKALDNIVTFSASAIALIGIAVGILAFLISRWRIHEVSKDMENRNQSLRRLFRAPLIFSAALLSFAHGANDVANAVGPLAAIVSVAEGEGLASSVDVPFWVMLIGAGGISLGLMLFGPRLIRMVGEQITKLNPMRAFCVALSAAITVIVASGFGMPVSSTHIAVGAVFGVGFFREWYTANSSRRRAYLQRKADRARAARGASNMPHAAEQAVAEDEDAIPDTSAGEEIARRRLVRRAHVTTIVTAWVTTVPASALLAGGLTWVFQFWF